MDTVAANRGYPSQPCQISYTEATLADVGHWLVVESLVTGAWMDCQIMDMPRPEHYQRIRDKGIVIELGWTATPALCAIQRVAQEPPRACPVRVWRR